MKHNFRLLQIWKSGIDIAVKTYTHCKSFPKEEIFGLSAQMKKAAVSISSNIAEGCGRGTDAQLTCFLDISLDSACELETQIVIAQKLQFLSDGEAMEWIRDIHSEQKQIRSFRDKVSAGLL
ncbi:MAG: four helix bundle protein [Saprospiraceae bacterium]|nr:four helix bundle protein [Saprospiraceae bacterium]